jgi:hypothetical protein
MKREYQMYDVTKHFPLLMWRKCSFCDKEFIRESGFKWLRWWGYDYACSTCCVSVSHCNDMITHKDKTFMAKLTGKVPPAPPMRTYRSK